MIPILIVEDEPILCRLYVRTLRGAFPDAAIVVAHCLADIPERLALFPAGPFVAIVDKQLPDGDGWAYASLPALPPGARPILMSGMVDHRLYLRLSTDGAPPWLEKPVSVAALIEAVRKASER